jgi:hypothetical protein
MKRVTVNGKRALIAYELAELPPENRHGRAQAEYTRDMWWLQHGDEMPDVLLAEPASAAVN